MANDKRPLRPLNPIIGCNRKRSPGMIQLSPLIKFTIPSLCPSSSSWSNIDTHSSAKLNPLQFFSLIKSWYQFNGIPELFLRLCFFVTSRSIILLLLLLLLLVLSSPATKDRLSSELSRRARILDGGLRYSLRRVPWVAGWSAMDPLLRSSLWSYLSRRPWMDALFYARQDRQFPCSQLYYTYYITLSFASNFLIVFQCATNDGTPLHSSSYAHKAIIMYICGGVNK